MRVDHCCMSAISFSSRWNMLGRRTVALKTLQYGSSGEPAGSGELSRPHSRGSQPVTRALRVTSPQNEDRSSAMLSSGTPTDLRVDDRRWCKACPTTACRESI